MAMRRGFQEITVGALGRQTGHDRFPREYVTENGIEIPRCTPWAMNVTALSQTYNLYLVAYGAKIYVYKPTGSRQLLSSEPLLILDLPQSYQGRTSGFFDPLSSHGINHLTVGNLGNKEIVLCACADGDVLAYYTERVNYAAKLAESLAPKHTQRVLYPFFHENVGISAWGLAIHQQSRLIAVSSNYHEVQVFVFALSGEVERKHAVWERIQGDQAKNPFDEFPELLKKPSPPKDRVVKNISRAKNFRLKLPLTRLGDNIPSIAFASDRDGDAMTVVASDIRGALWFLSIWDDVWKRLPTVVPTGNIQEPMGWGVLVLPPEFFKPARNMHEAYGCPEIVAYRTATLDASPTRTIDISPTITAVYDNIIWHHFSTNQELEFQMFQAIDYSDDDDDMFYHNNESCDESDDEAPWRLPPEATPANTANGDQSSQSSHTSDDHESSEGAVSEGNEEAAARRISGTILSNGQDNPLLEYFRRTSRFFYVSYPKSLDSFQRFTGIKKPHESNSRTLDHLVPDSSVIFHANRHDVTLIPTTCPRQHYTHCSRLLRQDIPHGAWFPHDITHYNRLNMLLTIPELSLVLVGSQVGRVALITVTRAAFLSHKTPLGTPSMRVDAILPFGSQDSIEGFRPSTGLLGIAVSPMPRLESGGRHRWLPRWRLLLHYYDHTILSYVISNEKALRVESI